jgi:DNA-directed RNA polymerase specialized sigma24 family protein
MATEHDDQRARGSPGAARASYRELDDAALVEVMRASDERAIEEYLTRFHRVVRERARASGLFAPNLDDEVSDLLEDVAVLIVNGRVRPTRSIAAYLMTALRRRLTRASIADADRTGAEERAAIGLPGNGERAVPSVVSESTWRATYGPDWVPLPVPRVVERLASMIEEGLSKEERFILQALSNFVAQRDICQWLGVSYAAGTQRIWRLRERLRQTAMAYADHFDKQERTELENFFLRFRDPAASGRTRRGTPRGGQG